MADPARSLKKALTCFRLFAGRLLVHARRLLHRCPRRVRAAGGPLLGGLAGLAGGIPGFFTGLLLGYLLKELFSQLMLNGKILDYLENPGPQRFYEGEPGLAAWCALGILTVSAGFPDCPPAAEPGSRLPGGKAQEQVMLAASRVFGPLAEPYLMELFTRLAWSRRDRLNPDLLAESLTARRASLGAGLTENGLRTDAGTLGRALSVLAAGEKARNLARDICRILDPASVNGQGSGSPGSGNPVPGDPWKILGLAPGTDPKEVKAHYRRLAKQFHPDELQILDRNQREAAARAFVAIKEAYNQVTTGR